MLTDAIYVAMTVVNIVLPFVWMLTFWYLSLQFAGFPFASADAQERLSKLGRLGCLWSVSRFGFGVVALTSVLQGWLTSAKEYHVMYCVLMVSSLYIIIIFSLYTLY